MMKFALLAAGVVASALCLSPTAGRSEPTVQVTRHIGYADLDLATIWGRSQLDRRIGTAVAEACGSASGLDLAGQKAVRRCRIATKQEAATQRDLALAAVRNATATRLALAAKP